MTKEHVKQNKWCMLKLNFTISVQLFTLKVTINRDINVLKGQCLLFYVFYCSKSIF